jgi:hypothetical protein
MRRRLGERDSDKKALDDILRRAGHKPDDERGPPGIPSPRPPA